MLMTKRRLLVRYFEAHNSEGLVLLIGNDIIDIFQSSDIVECGSFEIRSISIQDAVVVICNMRVGGTQDLNELAQVGSFVRSWLQFTRIKIEIE